MGFERCEVEHHLYVLMKGESILLLICLYVDDLFVTRNHDGEIETFKELMTKKYELTNLGRFYYFLGMKLLWNDKGIIMHQLKYAKEILKRFDMATCKAVTTPADMNLKLEDCLDEEKVDPTECKKIVGSLRYLCNSRPDLCCAIGVLSRFMNDPGRSHYMATKKVMRYVQGTMQSGIEFRKNTSQNCGKLISFFSLRLV